MFKKVLKGFLIFLLLIVVAGIALPFIFKDKIANYVQSEIDHSLNAKVTIGDFDLSLLKNYKNFPNITLSLSDLMVVGKEEFAKDTLAHIGEMSVSLDLMSVIKNEKPMKIYAIELHNPTIHAIVARSGKVNWDITKPSETKSESTPFQLSLKRLLVENGNIYYSDYKGNQFAKVLGLEHSGKGDFSQDVFDYTTSTSIGQLTFSQNGIAFLNRVKTNFDGSLNIDQKSSKYSFKENVLKLNDLEIKFNGWLINKEANKMNMDLQFNAEKTDFKSILSLIPAIYSKDFEKVKTAGKFALNGKAKGIYSENWYPSLDINFTIQDGKFQYPSLPTGISNVQMETHIQSPGGSLDKMEIQIPKLNMLVGSEPISMKLNLKTPISDPNIDLIAKGKLDLSKVKNYYPIEGITQLTGLMNIDLDLKSKMSDIKNKKYENVKASGVMQVFGLQYASKDVPKPLSISEMEMKFNPRNVELTKCAAKIGASDFSIKGTLDNVIGYMLAKGEVLTGNINLVSQYIDANEFLADSAESAKAAQTKNLQNSNEYVKVPDNINFTGSATIAKIRYDKINLTAVSGSITAKDETIVLNATKANLLGGNIQLKGVYSTKNSDKPISTLTYNIQNFDMRQVIEYVGMAKKMAPILQFVNGTFSSDMDIVTKLNPDMSPDLNSVTGTATFNIPQASIQNLPALKNIAEITKLQQLNNLNLSNVQMKMNIKNGRIIIDPFDVKTGNTALKISGSQGIDQTIDYNMSMDIPWKDLGAAASVADGLLAKSPIAGFTNQLKPEIIRMNLNVGGTFLKPVVKMGKPEAIKGNGQTVGNTVKETVKEQFDNVKQQAEERIRNTADSLKRAAEAQVQQKADELKKQAENKVKEEKDKLLNNLRKKLPW